MTLRDITSVSELHNYLATAVQLEHATIPPYLTALYSIHPSTNGDAYRIIRAVVVEEMLHLTLSANVLNAVGGRPDLTGPDFVPPYPTRLPDGETDFEVGLQRFSPEAVEAFMTIERPARTTKDVDRLAQRDRHERLLLPKVETDAGEDKHFYSIGEFYEAIIEGLTRLEEQEQARGSTLFGRGMTNQVGPEYYYSGGGGLIAVTDLDSAMAALDLVAEQGEGHSGRLFDDDGEIAHYYRYQQLVLGQYYDADDAAGEPTGVSLDVDWDSVYPIRTNVCLDDMAADPELHSAALAFNERYAGFLSLLTDSLTGKPELLIPGVGEMFRLKELATQLIRTPLPDGSGENAAPTFEMPHATEV